MIDPITALAGIQTAIKTVKQAAKVANDLGSLAPMIGKMFDARSNATKAMVEAKRSGNKSNLGTALQIEMALEQARAFEEELKMLFMQSGKIDVWNKIKARAAAMDLEDAQMARKSKEEDKKRKQKEQEQLELAIGIGAICFILFLAVIGVIELIDFCQTTHRCGR